MVLLIDFLRFVRRYGTGLNGGGTNTTRSLRSGLRRSTSAVVGRIETLVLQDRAD
jgi:hypothetical protein